MVMRDFLSFRKGRLPLALEAKHEQDEFNPDKFIDTLEKQYRNPSPPKAPIPLQCTLHLHYDLEKKESNTDYRHWEYYKCPFQDCFVCCGVDNVGYYLQSAR